MRVRGTALRKVIYLLGVPGTGKSSVGRELVRRLHGELVDVSELVVRKGLYTSYDREYAAYVADVPRISKLLAEKASSSNRSLVVSSNFAVRAPGARDFAVFLLRCNPLVLMKRLSDRGYDNKKISDNLIAELVGLSLDDACATFGSKNVVEIDATKRSMSLIVSCITDELARGDDTPRGWIDWISRLEGNPALSDLVLFISRHSSAPGLSSVRHRRHRAQASLKRRGSLRRVSAP